MIDTAERDQIINRIADLLEAEYERDQEHFENITDRIEDLL